MCEKKKYQFLRGYVRKKPRRVALSFDIHNVFLLMGVRAMQKLDGDLSE